MRELNRHILKLLLSAGMWLMMTGCVSDLIMDNYPDEPTPDPAEQAMAVFDMPGFMTVDVQPTGSTSTRADNSTSSSDGFDFNDGTEDESNILIGENGYHFVVLYDNTKASTPKAVLELTVNEGDIVKDNNTDKDNNDKTYNNLTLTVTKVYGPAQLGSEAVTTDDVKTYIDKNIKSAYALLNFNWGKVETSSIPPGKQTDISSATTTLAKLGLLTKGDLEDLVLNDYKITVENKDYFTMTNSVYVKENTKFVDCTIIPGNVFDNVDLARSNPAITIHVERLAAKYTLKFTNLLEEGNFVKTPVSVNVYKDLVYDATGYEIQYDEKDAYIKILGFGFNCTEKSSKLFKEVPDNPNIFTDYRNWNDNNNNRSYWAIDRNYTKDLDKYPHQYRLSLEADSVRSYHTAGYKSNGSLEINTTNSSYCLDYVSFKDLKFDEKETDWSKKVFYTHENTHFDPGTNGGTWDWPWKEAQYSMNTNLIVACQLYIGGKSTSQTVYRGQNDYFYLSESAFLEAKLQMLNEIILHGGNSGIRILKADWEGHEPSENDSPSDDLYIIGWNRESVLWIAEPTGQTDAQGNPEMKEWVATVEDLELIPAELSGGDGQSLIAPKKGNSRVYYLAPKKDDGTRNNDFYEYEVKDASGEIVPKTGNMSVTISYNHLISLIHKLIGPCDVYTDGYMYYTVPVPHNTPQLRGEDMNGEKASWKTTGDIGTVRNNWYEITVSSFNNVGTSVADIDQPIIPLLGVKRSYINVLVKLLGWHSINQELDFESSLDTKK